MLCKIQKINIHSYRFNFSIFRTVHKWRVSVVLSEGLLQAETVEHFAGDNDHGNHAFESIILVVPMALAASTCVWWRSLLI